MGTLLSKAEIKDKRNTERIWPVRYFNQAITLEDLQASRFSKWDPKMYTATLKYPAKEPPKDF